MADLDPLARRGAYRPSSGAQPSVPSGAQPAILPLEPEEAARPRAARDGARSRDLVPTSGAFRASTLETELRAALPTIPDAAAVTAPGNRYEALNERITDGYGALATRFQEIVDPGSAARGGSEAVPAWFAFAPYASREVGRGEMAVSTARALAATIDAKGEGAVDALRRIVPSLGRLDAELILRGVAAAVPGVTRADAGRAAAFLLALESEGQTLLHGSPRDLGALADPRLVAVGAVRMVELLRSAPGASIGEKLDAVATTLRNTLEDGNRRIFADVGGAAESYLRWREERLAPPSPDDVLRSFTLAGLEGGAEARSIYDWAAARLASGAPRPSGVEARFPSPPGDGKALMVAAFALYERARLARTPAERDAATALANEVTALREQRDAVAPAFRPGRVLPGEVDRTKLFRMLTPYVKLPLNDSTWTFAGYAPDLPARDGNALTPRATEYDWGAFGDRWPGILAAFEAAYGRPGGMWPMPGGRVA